jgi:hypothetical protein
VEASYDGRQIVGMDFAPAAAGAGADDRRWHGRWGWRGILAYLIGFAAMTPPGLPRTQTDTERPPVGTASASAGRAR